MSVHYDLFFAFDLKSNLPNEIINALGYVTGITTLSSNLPQDSQFNDGVWKGLLKITSKPDMLRFPGHSVSIQSLAYRYGLSEAKQGTVNLQTFTFRHEIKDDFMHEYLLFLSWVAPYSETVGYIGYFLSDLDYHYPVLLFFRNNKLIFQDTNPARPKADT